MSSKTEVKSKEEKARSRKISTLTNQQKWDAVEDGICLPTMAERGIATGTRCANCRERFFQGFGFKKEPYSQCDRCGTQELYGSLGAVSAHMDRSPEALAYALNEEEMFAAGDCSVSGRPRTQAEYVGKTTRDDI